MSAAPSASSDRLIAAAAAARSRAYCPYSRYPVGAAVLAGSGKIFAGCNVENASYGLSMCAERVAVSHAVAAGEASIRAVAIVGDKANPCGACRQVLLEFGGPDTEVFLVDDAGASSGRRVTRTDLGRLLPVPFDPRSAGLLPSPAVKTSKRSSR